jgi:hypothetical protein
MPRHQKMQVRPFSVFLSVLYDQNAKVLVAQSGPCRQLEALDHFLNLFFGRPVFRRKCDHRRSVRICVIQAVHQVRKKYRVTPPHDHLFVRSFLQQISRRFLSRSPHPQEFDMHGLTLP